ncbi:unnamed protein product [Effrenium voratum]|uniref:Uncharacterized protein n=1 Tax=Effrenium voratum TaxID=2562239 RepID=A0AA36MXV1_9DINO|nr:unnamed protein product [Effrenium voratum]
MEKQADHGGWLPPFSVKISLTFDGSPVQEVLNTHFSLLVAQEEIQSTVLEQLGHLMSASLPFVGRGMQEAAELHQKLQDIHTLSRTGTADLRPTPKALRLVLRARSSWLKRASQAKSRVESETPRSPAFHRLGSAELH